MSLPPDFYVPERQDIVDRYERDVKIRQPGAKVGPGSLAHLDGANLADHLLPIYANSVRAYRNTTLADADETALREKARAFGLPEILPASGGSGFVRVGVSTGGVFIAKGQILKEDKSQLAFQCTSGRTYGVVASDTSVPITGIATGPATNLAAGTSLRWENPPPGLAELATVLPDSHGKGLTGGRSQETPDELRNRIADAHADPPAAGNTAQVRKFVLDAAKTLGIPVQEVFINPAIRGPNTYSVAFTLRPETDGSSRAPNGTQRQQVRAFITGLLPHGDGIFLAAVLEEKLDLFLRVKWAKGAKGWADLRPYPLYDVVPAFVSGVTSPGAFQVTSNDVPRIGQTIAFYDAASDPPRYVRKKILTVTGAGPYDLTIDMALNASDPLYQPSIEELFCPWSDSLDLLVAPILASFRGLGPGEQYEDHELFDAGDRLRRSPAPPLWPNELTHRVTNGLDNEPAIANVSVISPSLPVATSVGTPAVAVNLLTLGRLLAFP